MKKYNFIKLTNMDDRYQIVNSASPEIKTGRKHQRRRLKKNRSRIKFSNSDIEVKKNNVISRSQSIDIKKLENNHSKSIDKFNKSLIFTRKYSSEDIFGNSSKKKSYNIVVPNILETTIFTEPPKDYFIPEKISIQKFSKSNVPLYLSISLTNIFIMTKKISGKKVYYCHILLIGKDIINLINKTEGQINIYLNKLDHKSIFMVGIEKSSKLIKILTNEGYNESIFINMNGIKFENLIVQNNESYPIKAQMVTCKEHVTKIKNIEQFHIKETLDSINLGKLYVQLSDKLYSNNIFYNMTYKKTILESGWNLIIENIKDFSIGTDDMIMILNNHFDIDIIDGKRPNTKTNIIIDLINKLKIFKYKRITMESLDNILVETEENKLIFILNKKFIVNIEDNVDLFDIIKSKIVYFKNNTLFEINLPSDINF